MKGAFFARPLTYIYAKCFFRASCPEALLSQARSRVRLLGHAKNRAIRCNLFVRPRRTKRISAPIPCAPGGRAAGICGTLILTAACVFLTACAPEVNLPAQYALVYGVDYRGTGIRHLEYTGKDAADFSDLLRRKGYTVPAPSPSVTRADMIADIDSLIAAGIERDSLFLFYFSGHGATGTEINTEFGVSLKAGSEYIAFRPVSSLSDAVVSDDELMRLISRVPSRQKIVIIDACNSGGFIGDSPGVDLAPPDYSGAIPSPPFKAGEAFSKYFANTHSGDIAYTEAIVIAAAGARESSWEITGYDHGVFTYYFLQSPRKADANNDGLVTASEAYFFTKNAIVNTWNSQNPRESFYPHISGGAMDYVLFEAD
jgi:hypothetical protein